MQQLLPQDKAAIERILRLSSEMNLNIKGGRVTRTSSRFCLGVEHGDYNGTELFGTGTDRFIWLAYKPNNTNRVRIFSANFPDDGLIEFELGKTPPPKSPSIANTWSRFAYGTDYILNREGFKLTRGIDAVVYGNIPGGGMSRSASLTLNLILSLLDANNIKLKDKFKIVQMAQAVENNYIGSPCGRLDQIMILFAKEGTGTHYDPKTNSIDYVPLGAGAENLRIVILDTGTIRPGLEKSTYKIRRSECEELLSILQNTGHKISSLADITDRNTYEQIIAKYKNDHPDLCDRLNYIFTAQQRFYKMLEAWKQGDIETVGKIFNEDGIGLRDDYKISGPELEAMCDIARSVPGVLGTRMLGGGDKGAAGALVHADAVKTLKETVAKKYPEICPKYKNKYTVHICNIVDGVKIFKGLL